MKDEGDPPMTDLAKSMFRFSWALSLFGASQAMDLLTGGRSESGAVADLEAVRYAAEEQMDGSVRSLFNAGDRVQRGMVDLAASLLDSTFGKATGTRRR
jgi:hypothetical protein